MAFNKIICKRKESPISNCNQPTVAYFTHAFIPKVGMMGCCTYGLYTIPGTGTYSTTIPVGMVRVGGFEIICWLENPVSAVGITNPGP